MYRTSAFLGTSDFVEGKLSELIAGRTSLNVLFATYNNVSGFSDGEVAHEKPGLKVVVQNGNLRYSSFAAVGGLVGFVKRDEALCDAAEEAGNEEAREAQRMLERKLEQAPDMSQAIAVVYAGLSAFDEALELARTIKRGNANAIIVVVTCDCDSSRKQRVLEPLLASEEIASVVMTSNCGGRATMGKICQAVIDRWKPASVQ